ncbi:hypothetical protein J2Y46_001359 [Microbacterium sp. BE35]|uniref:DUF7882 domain-containing protein n=1 Tax=Microbacterium trichothecenolyticum TaxID=69370 RepID=A0A0M2H939_MICTR|nr:hypothetical protein RS82_03270 [Microbacterium trichothecenolyticum]MDR7188536.1 hypothetical protein [Microbacterium sp. BE35]
MGTIYYGGGAMPIHIEDRALAHLKVVIATKLRRDESFTVSWRHPDDQPRGRSTIWIHPSIPLRFVFDDPEPTELSRAWIEELANSASSTGGIMLVAEHFDTGPVDVLQGAEGAPDVTLGNVDVDHLDVERLTVGGTEVTPDDADDPDGDG